MASGNYRLGNGNKASEYFERALEYNPSILSLVFKNEYQSLSNP